LNFLIDKLRDLAELLINNTLDVALEPAGDFVEDTASQFDIKVTDGYFGGV
jgi:hypothetical protein